MVSSINTPILSGVESSRMSPRWNRNEDLNPLVTWTRRSPASPSSFPTRNGPYTFGPSRTPSSVYTKGTRSSSPVPVPTYPFLQRSPVVEGRVQGYPNQPPDGLRVSLLCSATGVTSHTGRRSERGPTTGLPCLLGLKSGTTLRVCLQR